MTSWKDLSGDPNCTLVRSHREDSLRKAWHSPVFDRSDYLVSLSKGKRVLDIGIVDHFDRAGTNGFWLHDHIVRASAYCLGIDVLADEIALIRSRNYNVRVCDISKESLGEKFELVIAGEIIEHLGNMESLFSFGREQLNPGGKLVLTSPNPFYFTRFAQNLRNQFAESVDHVGFVFPSGIVEMAERHGLVLDSYRGIRLAPKWKGRLLIKLLDSLSWSQDILCEGYIYECVVL